MARPRRAAAGISLEDQQRIEDEEAGVEVVNDTGDDIDQPVDVVPVEEPTKVEESTDERLGRLVFYVESLRQEVVTLEQRIQDLELLISQPEGGVRFGQTEHFSEYLPQQPGVPDYVPQHVNQTNNDGVDWY